MSLIVCDQNCRHQRDGYCSLDVIKQLTNQTDARCGYFETPAASAKGAQGVPDSGDGDQLDAVRP